MNQPDTRCTELGNQTAITHECCKMPSISEMPFAFKDTQDPKVLVEEEEYY